MSLVHSAARSNPAVGRCAKMGRRSGWGRRASADGHACLELSSLGLDPSDQFIVERMPDGVALHRTGHDVRTAYIEATTRCNLRCITCVRHVWDGPEGDMSQDTYDRVMHGLRAFPGLRDVHFGGFGEPLLHPRIVEMVERAKSLGARVTLSTNGTLLNKTMAAALMDARLDRLFVSIDSTTSGLFREIRIGAELTAIVSNLKHVEALRAKRNSLAPTIGLEFVLMKQNRGEVAELPALARYVGASFVVVTHLLPHTVALADEIAYGDDGFAVAPTGGWPVLAGDHIEWGTLIAPRSRWGAQRRCRFVEGKGLVVGWDGGVSPCYALMHSYPYFIFGRGKQVTRYVLGNVNDKLLADVWTSEEYVLFRARVTSFRFPSCVDCGADCTYARGNEDCCGNAPSCADCLWAQDIIRCP